MPLLIAGGLALAAIGGALPETLAVPPAFAALLLALARSSGRARHPLEGRALHYLGEISYATYLGHYLLWFAFKLAFVSDAHGVGWPMIAALLDDRSRVSAYALFCGLEPTLLNY